MEHCAEGPTVEDSAGHFILCKGVAVCICTSPLITVWSHHDDGGAGVHEALCHWYTVVEQLLSLIFMMVQSSAQRPFY